MPIYVILCNFTEIHSFLSVLARLINLWCIMVGEWGDVMVESLFKAKVMACHFTTGSLFTTFFLQLFPV